MRRLEGKVAIVTGGNAGIGEAVAKRFAAEGASVTITGRRQVELDRVAAAIRQSTDRVLTVAGSVTDEAHVQEVMRATIHRFGRIDIVVNNAGIGDFG
ncbi:MAG: SDR family NAD(P)-dependent oxidoreductase, partial [Nitrospira sp.]